MIAIYKNSPYEIVITTAPTEFSYQCYGIKNTDTGVIEAYIGSLAKARLVCDQYAHDLAHGVTDPVDDLVAALRGAAGGNNGPGGMMQ